MPSPSIFLSYSGDSATWIEHLRRTKLIENVLGALSNNRFDYQKNGPLVAEYRQKITDRIEASDIFLMIADETYESSHECMIELDCAARAYFSKGKTRKRKVFAIIFLDDLAEAWWQRHKKKSPTTYPEDLSYLPMYVGGDTLYLYTQNNPNGEIEDKVRDLFKQILLTLGVTDPPPPLGSAIVLLGWPTAASVNSDGAIGKLRAAIEDRAPDAAVHTLTSGWADRTSDGGPSFQDLARSNAAFVLHVEPAFVDILRFSPQFLVDLLAKKRGLLPEECSRLASQQRLTYWLDPATGAIDPAKLSELNGALKAPVYAVAADDLGEAICGNVGGARPAPPIRYEDAPLHLAIKDMASKLREALDGSCDPADPTASAFVLDERPLRDELADIARAKRGIFITHDVNTIAEPDQIPEILRKKIFKWVEELEAFCETQNVDIEQIYKIALIRQRGEFWRGPISVLGGDNTRLVGWRFLGVKTAENGQLEIDTKRLANVVSDIKFMMQPD